MPIVDIAPIPSAQPGVRAATSKQRSADRVWADAKVEEVKQEHQARGKHMNLLWSAQSKTHTNKGYAIPSISVGLECTALQSWQVPISARFVRDFLYFSSSSSGTSLEYLCVIVSALTIGSRAQAHAPQDLP